MSRACKQPHSYQKAFLYRIVFDEKATRYLIALLFGFFVLHPAVPVFAADEEVTESAESEVVEEVAPEPEPEEIAEPEESESNDEVAGNEEAENTDEGVTEEPPESIVETDELAHEEVAEVDEDAVESVVEAEEANEEASETDDAAEEEIDVVEEMATTTISESVLDVDTGTTTAGIATSSSVTGEASSGSNVDSESSSEEIIETATSTATTTETVEEATEPPAKEESETNESDVGSNSGSNEVNSGLATSTDEAVTDENASTTSAEPKAPIVVHNVNSDDPLHFTPQDCVAVGDGSFYCEKQAGQLPTYEDDEIYVATDADGDKEIFIRLRGEEMQLTHNLVDDSAPKFDPRGGYMTWHRLVDDRYQIILYDLETKEETQLTHSNHNNMQPDIFDGQLVWQTWDGQDWEVAYYDGNETIALTDNEFPDLSPHLNDTYVIWNTIHESSEKAVVVYDLATGQVELIEDGDDVMVKNPRMILMYEAEFDNGDIVTRGFDIETGRIIPLTASPEELPDELPEPDQTGETRALISSKTNARENEDTADVDVVTKPVATSSTPDIDPILDLTDASSTPSVSSSAPPTDLVVTEFVGEDDASITEESIAASSSPVSHIEDVVIPAGTSTETD